MHMKVVDEKSRTGIKFISTMLLIVLLTILSPCSPAVAALFSGNNGCKILIVSIEKDLGTDESKDVSDVVLIRQALEKGGMIVLNTDVAKEIDSQFESKYAAVNVDGQYFIAPALLNFIGGQGWVFVQIQGVQQYYFVKER